MKRLIFSFPEELIEQIEAYRRGRGLKATAEAVRELIERGLGGDPAPADSPDPRPSPPDRVRSKTVTVGRETAVQFRSGRAVMRDALTGEPVKSRGPMQKGGGKRR